jgi:CBS domain-containing protein
MPSYRRGKVENIAHREPVFVRADETLGEVARTMWSENVGALVVGDERQVLGIVSERDLVSRIGQGEDLDALTAKDVMTGHLAAVRVGDTLDDAAYLMLESGVRHLPLMDHHDRVIGMVSVRDLLRPLLSDGPDIWGSAAGDR